MKSKTKIFRSIMCGLLAFFISLSLLLISSVLVVKLTVLNPNYVVSVLNKSNYSDHLHAELKNEFISYGAACNINESFFDKAFEEIITVEQINKDTEESIRDFYSNNVKVDADYTEIQDKLFEQLKTYASENGYTLDSNTVGNLGIISQELAELYDSFVGTFKSSYFKTAADLLSRYAPLLNYALIGISVFALLAALVIFLSFGKLKNRLRYIIYATSGATLMILVAPAAALIMGIGNRVSIIADASLYGLVSGFINNFFVSMLIAGGVMAVITVILHIIRIKVSPKKHRKKVQE